MLRNINRLPYDILNFIGEEYLIVDEGQIGVIAGYYSSDRTWVGRSWPTDRYYFLGNSDAIVYETAGKPDGQPIQGRILSGPECDEYDRKWGRA